MGDYSGFSFSPSNLGDVNKNNYLPVWKDDRMMNIKAGEGIQMEAPIQLPPPLTTRKFDDSWEVHTY